MSVDGLNDPLGQRAPRRSGRHIPYRLIAIGGLGLLIVAVATFVFVTGDPRGGEPFAVAAISPLRAPDVAPIGSAPEATASVPAIKRRASAQDVEAQSGVKVVRVGGGSAPDAMIIEVPPPLGVSLAPAPDPRLVETTRYGPIPRVGPDGARASAVYARPVVTSSALPAHAPRIALLVGGMGLSGTMTDQALATLPAAVTLGFAPYGSDLDRTVAAARDRGHEVVLQVPMEPFDYPRVEPGPHALLSSVEPAVNSDQLKWLMSRFQGYIGLSNFLGAKFTSDDAAFRPILREMAARGLVYVDDGSSARSLANALAPQVGLPMARADVVLDASGRPEAIDASLARLEAMARERGSAIGAASALPASLERIARFAQGLEARGIALVPVSALVTKERMPMAERAP